MTLRHLKYMPHIVAVMTPFPYSIDIDASLAQARRMMQEHRIRHLPVMESGKLVSVCTDQDIIMTEDRLEGASRKPLTVRHACVMYVYTVHTNAPLDQVVMEMAERHIGSALVLKDDRLAGIFTSSDACRYLGELLRAQFPDYTGGGDEVA